MLLNSRDAKVFPFFKDAQFVPMEKNQSGWTENAFVVKKKTVEYHRCA